MYVPYYFGVIHKNTFRIIIIIKIYVLILYTYFFRTFLARTSSESLKKNRSIYFYKLNHKFYFTIFKISEQPNSIYSI